jgi:hypothetical protein
LIALSLREEVTMTYRISYEDGVPLSWRNTSAIRTETFRTEHEALQRARELLDSDYRAVAVYDNSGKVLGGVRLQLKLGFSGE